MKKKVIKRLGIGFGVLVVLLGLAYVDLAIYPFAAAHPNFSDVERVFNRIQFPADWKQTASNEDSGIAGRQCPWEGSGCFSKGKDFEIAPGYDIEKIKDVLKSAGCNSVSYKRSEQLGGSPYSNLDCSIDGLNVVSSITEEENVWKIGVEVRTF